MVHLHIFCTTTILSEIKIKFAKLLKAFNGCPGNFLVVPVWQRKLYTLDRMPFNNHLISIKIVKFPKLYEGKVLSQMWIKRMEQLMLLNLRVLMCLFPSLVL